MIGQSSSVTFSGLLNAIDGIASQEGRIFFLTTNHADRLDPALMRPGRVDYLITLDLASKTQIERLFLRFYPEEKSLAKDFADKVPATFCSMAQLQSHFMLFKDQPLEALHAADELIKKVEHEHERVRKQKEEFEERKLQRQQALKKKLSAISKKTDLVIKPEAVPTPDVSTAVSGTTPTITKDAATSTEPLVIKPEASVSPASSGETKIAAISTPAEPKAVLASDAVV
eukprot:TRINITY_DN5796_c0_g1_i1.p1 TRINITY_DN5796_c0_g1~~TRINITY_DN5796_c0_g1_i1.p1  ORF type:complete len:252 (-),score=40.83 TRINITY_DN5796_c0_g1_i1:776-1462(-)